MKKTLFVSLFLMMCIGATAQDIASDFKTESKAALLEGTKGIIFKRATYPTMQITCLSGIINMTPVVITDLKNGEKASYVRISSLDVIGSNEYSSIIDYDEIPTCVEIIDYIINNHDESGVQRQSQSYRMDRVKNQTLKAPSKIEYVSKTRDGLIITADYTESMLLSKGTLLLTHSKYLSNPSSAFPVKKLQEIKEWLESAMLLLSSAMVEQ